MPEFDLEYGKESRIGLHSSKLLSEGGSIEYFIGWFGQSNIGLTLSPETMSKTAKLGIAMSFDVYPGESSETAS